jgi:uncharacterized protein, YhcH/YjgK/YiaL family
MILDSLAQASLYRPLGPRFAAGLDWLLRLDLSLPDGRYAIEGDDVYALVQSYETQPAGEKRFESHRVYADIHYIVSGMERIDHAFQPELTPITDYDESKDFLLYADPAAATSLRLGVGSFAVFLPADAHRPGCTWEKTSQMRKVVVKVRV